MIVGTKYSFPVFLEKDFEQKVLREAEIFNEALSGHGIRLTFAPSRYQGRKGLTGYSAIISIDPEIAGRGAGRKPLSGAISMEEALRLEEQGDEKAVVAEKMGISIATYYRRRKQYLEDKSG